MWGAEYVDAGGVKRIVNDAVGFTSAAPDATTVDYSVKGYDDAGKLIYSSAADDGCSTSGGARLSDEEPAEPGLGAR